MNYRELFAMALRPVNLTAAEWDSFNNFFEKESDEFRSEAPLLYQALCKLKANQAKLETIDYLGAQAMAINGLDSPYIQETRRKYNVGATN